jgi:hypothetical protein
LTPLDLLLAALAVWRLSALLAQERGPFAVFLRLRTALGVAHNDDGEVDVIPEGGLAELLTCSWCNSMWIGAAVAAGLAWAPGPTRWVLAALAFSAGAIGFDRLIRRV